jgi:hypothetical protein
VERRTSVSTDVEIEVEPKLQIVGVDVLAPAIEELVQAVKVIVSSEIHSKRGGKRNTY